MTFAQCTARGALVIRAGALALLVSLLGFGVAHAETLTPSNISDVLTSRAAKLNFSVKFKTSSCQEGNPKVCDILLESERMKTNYKFRVEFQSDEFSAAVLDFADSDADPGPYFAAQMSIATIANILTDGKVGIHETGSQATYQQRQLKMYKKADTVKYDGLEQSMTINGKQTEIRISRSKP